MKSAQFIAQARNAGRAALDEFSGKQLLASFGVAVPRSTILQNADSVVKACEKLRPPFVLKVMSTGVLHKSDVGGVKVDLNTAADVEAAMASMLKQPAIAAVRIDGFLLEEMAPAGQEIVIGGVFDPQFGPLVMVGLGGIFVEILADVAFRICPIQHIDAHEMLGELRGAALLDGARGTKPVSRQAIVDVLLKVGGEHGLLMTHGDDIAEADINPLIVSDCGAVAVDARFMLTKA